MLHRSKVVADLILLIVAAIWGSVFVAQRTAMEHVSPLMFNGMRFLAGGLVLLIYLGPRRLRAITKHDAITGTKLGLILVLGASLQQLGVAGTTAGKAGFITGLYVVLVPVLLAIFWRRFESLAVWIGATLALVGMGLLSIGSDFSLSTGDMLVFLCAIVFSFHVICVDLFVQRVEPLNLAFFQVWITAVGSMILALLFEENSVPGISSAWFEILYGGAISVGFGYTMQIVAQRNTGPADVAIILSLESVFAVLTGWWILNEQLSTQQVIGCAMMFAGMIVAQVGPRSSRKMVVPVESLDG